MIIDFDSQSFEIPGMDGVIVDISPLDFASYQKVIGWVGKLQGTQQADSEMISTMLTQLSNPDLLKISESVIPSHCKNLTGLSIKSNGEIKNASVNDLVKHGSFAQICLHLLIKLFSISTIAKPQEAQLKKP